MSKQAGHELSETDKQTLAALNPDDAGDLEQLLATLQSALNFASATSTSSIPLGTTPHDVAWLRSLRTKLNRSLAKSCELPTAGMPTSGDSPWHAHQVFFQRLLRARRNDLPRPRIFTTNYDLVIERALDDLGVPYIDGFAGTVDRRLDLSTYDFDIYRTNAATQQVVERVEEMLHLYKVHGSLNWQLSHDTAGIDSIKITQRKSEELSEEDVLLIYPTPAKERDTLAFPYSDLFRLLSNSLQVPDTALLCIGYGFWDAHINRMILSALSSNPSMTVMIVAPNALYGDPATLHGTTASTNDDLTSFGKPLEDTPIAKLAGVDDSRIAVVTGEVGRFEIFATVMPDPQPFESTPSSNTQLQDALEELGSVG